MGVLILQKRRLLLLLLLLLASQEVSWAARDVMYEVAVHMTTTIHWPNQMGLQVGVPVIIVPLGFHRSVHCIKHAAVLFFISFKHPPAAAALGVM